MLQGEVDTKLKPVIRFVDETGTVHNFRSDPKASFGKMVPQIMISLTSLRRYDFGVYARKTSQSSDTIDGVLPLEAEFDIVSRGPSSSSSNSSNSGSSGNGDGWSRTHAMENAEMIIVLRDCVEAVLSEDFPFYIRVNMPGLSELVFDWCGVARDRSLRDRLFKVLCKKSKKPLVERIKKFTQNPDPGIKTLTAFLSRDVLFLGTLENSQYVFQNLKRGLAGTAGPSSSAAAALSGANASSSSSSSSSASVAAAAAASGAQHLSAFSALSGPSRKPTGTYGSNSNSNSSSTGGNMNSSSSCSSSISGSDNPIAKLSELNAALRDASINTDTIVVDPFFYAEQCKGFVFQARVGDPSTPGEPIASGYRYDDLVTTKEHPLYGIGFVLHVDVLQQRLAAVRKSFSSGPVTSGAKQKRSTTATTSSAKAPPPAGGSSAGTALTGRRLGGSGGDFWPTRKVLVCSSVDSWAPLKMAARLWPQRIHTEIITGCDAGHSPAPIAVAKMADWVVEVTRDYRQTDKVALRRIDQTTTSNRPRAVLITEAASAIIREALFKDYASANPDRFGRGVGAFAGPGAYTSSSPPPLTLAPQGQALNGIRDRDPAGSRFLVQVLGSRPKEWTKKITEQCRKHLALSLEGLQFEAEIPCFALEMPFEDISVSLSGSDDSDFAASSTATSRAKGRKALKTAAAATSSSDENETVWRKLRQELITRICQTREPTIIVVSLSERSMNQFIILGQTQISNIQKMYNRPEKKHQTKRVKKVSPLDMS